MRLITRTEMHDLFGRSLGESAFTYAEKHLRNKYQKKVPGRFVTVIALNLDNVIKLLEQHVEKKPRQCRYPAIWRREYDTLMKGLLAL